MGSVFVADGYIKVTEEGDFYRAYNGRKCVITEAFVSKENKIDGIAYGVVTWMNDCVQLRDYAHRLYAEAFIEKPSENHVLVSAKDGNFLNLTKDNIFWITKSERAEELHARLYTEKITCQKCGHRYYNKKSIKKCPICKYKEKRAQLSAEKSRKKLESIKKEYAHVDVDKLTNKKRAILDMRLKGMPLVEIGENLGISKQAVDQSLQRMKTRR